MNIIDQLVIGLEKTNTWREEPEPEASRAVREHCEAWLASASAANLQDQSMKMKMAFNQSKAYSIKAVMRSFMAERSELSSKGSKVKVAARQVVNFEEGAFETK